MVADMGTKALTSTRLEALKKIGMDGRVKKMAEKELQKEEVEAKTQEKEDEMKMEGSSTNIDREKAVKILKVLIIAASVSAASAQGEEDDPG